MIIPIVFATDSNYVLQTCVAMESVMGHITDSEYIEFFVLHSGGLGEKEIKELQLVEKRNELCKVTTIDVGDKFIETKVTLDDVNTQATFYRLGIPEFLPQYEKCIYLDSDIIVNNNISQLMNEDIDEYYIAGVIAYSIAGKENQTLKNIILSSETDKYINAGVLLINLKKIRKDGKDKEFYENMIYSFPMQDQDILNRVCAGKIKTLPFKYNVMTKYYKWNYDQYKGLATSEEIAEAWSKPIIIHYADIVKPWKNMACPFSDEWWNGFFKLDNIQEKFSALRVGIQKEYETICDKKDLEIMCTNRELVLNICDTLKLFKKRYIYGAGKYGKRLMMILAKKGIPIESFIVTSNLQTDDNVMNIEEFCRVNDSDSIIAVAVSDNYLEEILSTLNEHSVKNYMIFDIEKIKKMEQY